MAKRRSQVRDQRDPGVAGTIASFQASETKAIAGEMRGFRLDLNRSVHHP